MTAPLLISVACASHPGLVSNAIDHSILTDPTGALWTVADAIGGHSDLGVVARVPHCDACQAPLGAAPHEAHADAQQCALACGLGQIGATVAPMLDHDRLLGGGEGDPRAYLLPGGAFVPITLDRSLVVCPALLSGANAEDHPQARTVTRTIGIGEEADPNAREPSGRPGHRLLPSSDGLTLVVPKAEIAAPLAAAPEPKSAFRAGIEANPNAGAPDNVSAVTVAIGAKR